MQLEFHQLERRLEHLRAHRPERQQRLLASLAASGQQTPVIVIAADQPERYLLIDGYRRVRALEQLGRDTVEAVVWSLSEAEALFLDRSMAPASRPRLWKRAGCWRRCRSASAMTRRSWRGASIAA